MIWVVATGNLHKRDEMEAILRESGAEGLRLESLRDYPSLRPPEETGVTFAENARVKALALSRCLEHPTLADDSGLAVDALDGGPGIRSARYAGENASDADRIAKLLDAMRDVPPERRTARFVCAMTLAHRGRIVVEAEGVCEGFIAPEPKGESGFGYDPIFLLPEHGRTMAEVGSVVKNRVSHRARALGALLESARRFWDDFA